jgi:hypothetical protein
MKLRGIIGVGVVAGSVALPHVRRRPRRLPHRLHYIDGLGGSRRSRLWQTTLLPTWLPTIESIITLHEPTFRIQNGVGGPDLSGDGWAVYLHRRADARGARRNAHH